MGGQPFGAGIVLLVGIRGLNHIISLYPVRNTRSAAGWGRQRAKRSRESALRRLRLNLSGYAREHL
jgi:hypothetical protein